MLTTMKFWAIASYDYVFLLKLFFSSLLCECRWDAGDSMVLV
jgi:hypothetical protein